MTDEKTSVEAYVDAAAALIGLPIAPEHRAAVIANFELSRTIAAAALRVSLPDDLTAGPVFRP